MSVTSSEELQAKKGAGASEIAEIFPERKDTFPNLESPQFQDPDHQSKRWLQPKVLSRASLSIQTRDLAITHRNGGPAAIRCGASVV